MREEQLASLLVDDTTQENPIQNEPTSVDVAPGPPDLSSTQTHLKLVPTGERQVRSPPIWPFQEESTPPGARWAPRRIDSALKEIVPPDDSEISTPLVEVVSVSNLNLRRNESVLAEVAAERRSTLWRVHVAARRMSTELRAAVDRLQASTKSAVRRFETLPRKRQLMWVLAPYVGALVLILLLWAIGASDADSAEPVPPPGRSKVAPTPVQEARVPAPAPEQAPPTVEQPPARKPAPAPAELRTELHQLPVWSRLYTRPDAGYKIAAHLRPGTKVTIYPDFPTEPGWHLAESEKGTIGFIQQARLDGIPAKKKSRRRRR